MASIGTFTADFVANMSGFTKPIEDAGKGLADFQGAAKLATGAGLAIGTGLLASAKHAADFGEQLFTASAKTGIATEKLAGMKLAAEQSGASFDTVITGLKKMAANAFDAADGAKAQSEMFGKLGISVTDASGELRPMNELLLDAADKFKEMKNPTEAAATAQDLFGKAGLDLLPMLKDGREGIEAYTEKAKDFGLSMTAAEAAAGESFGDTLGELTGAFSGLFNTVGLQMIPVLSDLVEAVTPTITALKDFVAEHPGIVLAVAGFAAALTGTGGIILALGALSAAVAAISAPILLVFGAAGAIAIAVGAIWWFVTTNEDAQAALSIAWEAITTTVSVAFDAMMLGLDTFSALISGDWTTLSENLKTIWSAAFQTIKGALTAPFDSIKLAVGAFATTLGTNWTTFTGGIKTAWDNLWKAIDTAVTAPIKAIKDTISGFTTTVSGSFKTLYDAVVGKSYIPDLISGIDTEFLKLDNVMVKPAKAAISSLTNAFSGMTDGLIDKLTKDIPVVGKLVGDMLKGISDSIVSQFTGIFSKFTSSIPGLGSVVGNAGSRAAGMAQAPIGGLVGGGGSALGGLGGAAGAFSGLGSAALGGLIGGGLSFLGSLMGEGNLRRTEENTRETRDWLEIMANSWDPLMHEIGFASRHLLNNLQAGQELLDYWGREIFNAIKAGSGSGGGIIVINVQDDDASGLLATIRNRGDVRAQFQQLLGARV